jgi:hypothetical protein
MTQVEDSDWLLVSPAELVIDARARARLAGHPDRGDPAVSAIVAPVSSLAPGGSYRTHAEWCALEAAKATDATDVPVEGVAIVRVGVKHSVDDRIVKVDAGKVLVDATAPSHDPWGDIGSPEPASERGRSPFPRRPLVLFLGLEADLARAVWARNLVNELIGEEIEPRLCVPSVPAGPHLTRPCAPTRESVRALRPDLVVTLDDTAAREAASWCDHRSTITIQHTGERTLATELVPWRLGVAEGRLRGLIGSAVRAGELADICRRLRAGPLPVPPPAREPQVRVTSVAAPRRTQPTTSALPSVAVVRSSWDDPDDRLERFVVEASALGAPTAKVSADEIHRAEEYDAVIVSGRIATDAALDLVAARTAAGRRTIVDVDALPTTDELVKASGAVTTSTNALRAAVVSSDVVVRLLPSLLTRSELDVLRRARTQPLEDAATVGVRVDDARSTHTASVAAAVGRLLETDRPISVEWTGSTEHLPPPLAADERLATLPLLPAEQCGHWSLQCWIAAAEPAVSRPDPLVRLAYLGVPTICDPPSCGEVMDDVICRWTVDDPADPDRWMCRMDEALQQSNRARDSLAVRAEVLFGPRSVASIVNRILGWASMPSTRR